MIEVDDVTKPDFSLSGVWIEKDVDTDYANKVTEMNKEEGKYEFLANTKPARINGEDRDVLLEYVLNDNCNIENTNSLNRIILKIINTNQVEPIKASRRYNAQEKRIEISVTYTANGISKILNSYGEEMPLTEENGVIQANTGNEVLGKGTYKFTVIDNKGNKQELSIIRNSSLFNVAYVNGIDNMDNSATYSVTLGTQTEDEKAVINQLYDKLYETNPDSVISYRRAIKYDDYTMTLIESLPRTDADEQLYFWSKCNAKVHATWKSESGVKSNWMATANYVYRYRNVQTSSDSPFVTFSNLLYSKGNSFPAGAVYTSSKTFSSPASSNSREYYCWTSHKFIDSGVVEYTGIRYYSEVTYSKGDFIENVIGTEDAYENNKEDSTKKYWYERKGLSPKYTICKYDANLNIKSRYDVDTKTLITEPIDISNKGRNKLKLTLITSGIDYKTYISNDNINWQEVTDITSGIPRELNVDDWNSLYIKIDTNTSVIDSIDVAYYVGT